MASGTLIPPDEGHVTDIDVSVEMKSSFLTYAYSVIYARALPDARDGMKPVQRRIHFRIALAEQGDKAQELVRELQRLISAHRGENEVVVHIDESGVARKFVLEGHRARYTPELLRIARRVFGEKNVWVESDRAQ